MLFNKKTQPSVVINSYFDTLFKLPLNSRQIEWQEHALIFDHSDITVTFTSAL